MSVLSVWAGFLVAKDGTEKSLQATQSSLAPDVSSDAPLKTLLEKVAAKDAKKVEGNLEIISKADKAAVLYRIPRRVRREKTPITCKHLIRNQLTVPPDGRVDRICGAAMQACIVYESMKHLEKRKDNPFSKEKTRYLKLFSRAQSKRWRAFCYATRIAFKDPKFQEEIFDWTGANNREAENL